MFVTSCLSSYVTQRITVKVQLPDGTSIDIGVNPKLDDLDVSIMQLDGVYIAVSLAHWILVDGQGRYLRKDRVAQGTPPTTSSS